MNWFREFKLIKRKQLEIENLNLSILVNIEKHVQEIKEMLEVKAVVKQRGGQKWKN